MSADPNKKTARTFQCRDVLWDAFQQMAQELECSVDYLINESMKQYARQRYGRAQAARTQAGQQQSSQTPPPQPPSGRPSQTDTGTGSVARPAPATPSVPAQTTAPPPAHARVAPPSPPPVPPPGPLPPPTPPPPLGSMSGVYVPPPPARGKPPTLPPPPTGRPTTAAQSVSLRHQSGATPIPGPGPGPGAVPMARTAPPPLPSARVGSGMSPPPAPPGAGSRAAALAGGPPVYGQLSIIYAGERLQVTKDRFVIGRGKQSSDLTIKDPNVSRQHAMIEFVNGQYYMVDMGSTNGVEYAGHRISRRPIGEGDVFRICDHEVRFTYR